MSDIKTAPVGAPDASAYLQKLVKLIPAEIIALYLTIGAFLPKEPIAQFIVAGLCFVLTPLYLSQVVKVKNVLQVVLSTLAYAVWVFATGGPFTTMSWYQSWMPGSLLAVFTLVVPMFFSKTLDQVPAADPSTLVTNSGSKSWREV